MKNKRFKIILITVVSLGLGIGLVLPAKASILPSCVTTGNCTPCDLIQVGVNAGQALLAVVGSLVLLMFIYGGFTLLVSGGKPDLIKKGQNILINSVIGLGIVFTAYLLVTAVITVITGGFGEDAEGGWNWEGKLVCEPIDFSPIVPENAANLTGTINVPEDLFGNDGERAPTVNPGGASDGVDCTDKDQCKSGICYEKALGTLDDNKGKCQSVFQEGDPCKNMNIDDSGAFGLTSGLEDDIKCYGPGDMVCKDIGEYGKCEAGGEGTTCGDEHDCGEGTFCWDYADGIPGNEIGNCVGPLGDGKICEDAIIAQNESDPNAPCAAGLKCKDPDDNDWLVGGETGKCGSSGVGAICYHKSHCDSGYCWEYWDGSSNNGIGKCVNYVPNGEKCEDANIDKTEYDNIPCATGYKCCDSEWLTFKGYCKPVADCP